jgi:hypothetical protein
MDDQVLMRELDRFADLLEQLQAIPDGQMIRFAIVINPLSLHEFHYQVGSAVFSSAAVEQLCDAWMFEIRQQLALSAEASQHRFATQLGVNEFNRDNLSIFLVRAACGVNTPHPTHAEEMQELICTYAASGPRPLDRWCWIMHDAGCAFEVDRARCLLSEQRFHFAK